MSDRTTRINRIMYEVHHGRLFERTTYRLYLYAEGHQDWSGLMSDWLGDRLDDLGVLWTKIRASVREDSGG